MKALSLEHFKEYAKTILNEYKPLQKRQYSNKVIDEQVNLIKQTLESSTTVDIDPDTRSRIIYDTMQECKDLYFSQPRMFRKNNSLFSKS